MFKFKRMINTNASCPEPEFLEVTDNEAVIEGEAMYLSAGKLTKATGTTKPTHIALAGVEGKAGVKDFPAFLITPNMLFEAPVTFSSPAKPLVVGTKVTIGTDGEGITDVVTSGVCTIKDTLQATKTGDAVVVAFE